MDDLKKTKQQLINELVALRHKNEKLEKLDRERKRVDEALREKERRLSEAERIAQLGHWELDITANTLVWSDEIYRIFEIDPDKFGASYEAFLNSVHPEDRNFVDKAYTDSVKNKTNYDIAHRLLLKDGSVKYVNEKCQTTYDEQGNPLRSLGTVLDITERKLAEARLDRETDRAKLLLDLYLKAPQLTDKELYDYVLEKTVSLTESTIGFFHQVADDQKTIILTTWNNEALNNCTAAYNTRYSIGDAGNWVDCVRFKRPIIYNDFPNSPNQKGLPEGHTPVQRFMSIPVMEDDKVRFIFGVGNKPTDYEEHDVLQLQLVANELDKIILQRQTEEALRASEHRYRNTLDTMMEGCQIIDLDWRYLYINAAAAEHGQQSREELLGNTMMEMYPGIENTAMFAMLRRCREEQIQQRIENEFTYPDGTKGWFDLSIQPIPEGLFILSVDITERKEAEEQLREYSERLEEMVEERTAQLEAINKELEAFSYSVSHDLRAPLRAIDGFGEALLEDCADQLDDEGKRLLEVIRKNTKQMGQLIDDLLAFSRLGQKKITPTDIDMNSLAKGVSEDLKVIAPEWPQVKIKKLPLAWGDRSMIYEVWINLLSNAIKFSRPVDNPEIEISGKAKGNENMYWIRDNGVGFDMKYADKLFGVFQRLHSTAEFEGTGVGLALAQRVINRHGGRIWAEGEIGKGATFYFTLPKKKGEDQ